MKISPDNFYLYILDTFFPIKCLGCHNEGAWICRTCASQIRIETEHPCGVCEKVVTPDGRTCIACKKKSSLDGLIAATTYKEPFISNAVHIFKYRFIQDLHIELGYLLVGALHRTDMAIPDAIIPVPLHPRRLRWRGFNQSALLAQYVAKNLLPMSELPRPANVLIRRRYTSPQMEIKDYQSRQQNLAGAFSIAQPEEVFGKTILLIDDVATTGSTIFECAKVLKAAGAKEVYAAVIARQEIKR